MYPVRMLVMAWRIRRKVLLLAVFCIALCYLQLMNMLESDITYTDIGNTIRFYTAKPMNKKDKSFNVQQQSSLKNLNKISKNLYHVIEGTHGSVLSIMEGDHGNEKLNVVQVDNKAINRYRNEGRALKAEQNSPSSDKHFENPLIVKLSQSINKSETGSNQSSTDLHIDKQKTVYEKLLHLHQSVMKYTSDDEVAVFYGKNEVDIFNEPIDIENIAPYAKYLFPSEYNKPDDRILNQLNLKLVNTTRKTILFYSPINFSQKDFDGKKCNVNNCLVTTDKSKFHDADAVIFRSFIPFEKRPPETNKQIWIWSSLESGENSPKVSIVPDIVNWTETYRRDSDIVSPYERFTPHKNVKNLPTIPLKNFAANKTRRVAWFVSNCNAKNKRMLYVRELMKYIDVDIFGRCGKFTCPRVDKKCFQRLKSEYKFYLAFENTNCKDYISEKLYWNSYWNNIVPIVMGAHPRDYKTAVPPRSFIHVDMFKSPKHLAEYLHFLDANDDLYNSFFLWKDTGSFIDTKSICRICAMVHVGEHVMTHYDNVNEWWSGKGVCRRSVRFAAATWKNKTDIPIL